MGNCYSTDPIAEDHIHIDIRCNTEKPQQKYRLGMVTISYDAEIYSNLEWLSRDNLLSPLFALVAFMTSFYRIRSEIQGKIT